MQYEQTKSLTEGEFKRLFGVKRQTFDEMVGVMHQYTKLKKTSGSPKLSREDQVLVALKYWRSDRTYCNLASDGGVSESTVCRTVHPVENTLIRSGRFSLPGKKSLRQEQNLEIVAFDVTESPIERPKHGQKRFYSGKKKHHTFKSQIVHVLGVQLVIR